MSGLLTRRRAMMSEKATSDAPLYEFENGSRQYLLRGNYSGSLGDMRVSNGNHFYFYKRWGDAANLVLGELTVNGAPFTLASGDVVRMVIRFDSALTNSAGLNLIAGPTNTSANGQGNIRLIAARDIASNPTAESTITITSTLAAGAYNIYTNPVTNTGGQKWEGDIEIYVNGVRYI